MKGSLWRSDFRRQNQARETRVGVRIRNPERVLKQCWVPRPLALLLHPAQGTHLRVGSMRRSRGGSIANAPFKYKTWDQEEGGGGQKALLASSVLGQTPSNELTRSRGKERGGGQARHQSRAFTQPEAPPQTDPDPDPDLDEREEEGQEVEGVGVEGLGGRDALVQRTEVGVRVVTRHPDDPAPFSFCRRGPR